MKRFVYAKNVLLASQATCASSFSRSAFSRPSLPLSSCSREKYKTGNCLRQKDAGNNRAWHLGKYTESLPLIIKPKVGSIHIKIVRSKCKKRVSTKSQKPNISRTKNIAATADKAQCNLLQRIRHASYSSNLTANPKDPTFGNKSLEVAKGTPLIFIVVANVPYPHSVNKPQRPQVHAIETTANSDNVNDVLGDVSKRLDQVNESLLKALHGKGKASKGHSQQSEYFNTNSVNSITSIPDLIEFLKQAEQNGSFGCHEVPLQNCTY